METRNLIFVNDKSETQHGFVLKDGRILSQYDNENHFYLRYDYPIDLENGTYIPHTDIPNAITLNTLIEKGEIVKDVYCYDECEYYEPVYPDQFEYSISKIGAIKNHFKKLGYNVTLEAVKYCIDNWMGDLKSGYRDDKNGYHLFCPCGCNPLSIRLTTLNDKFCKDWQKTYYA